MSKPAFCGAADVPKTKRRGSMLECAEQGQIRYYGIKKIDSRTFNAAKKSRQPSRLSVLKKMATLKGKINYIKKNLAYEKNADKKAKMKADMVTHTKDLADVMKLLKTVSKKRMRRASSRARSRKGSKIGSRKGSKHLRRTSRKSRSRKSRSRR